VSAKIVGIKLGLVSAMEKSMHSSGISVGDLCDLPTSELFNANSIEFHIHLILECLKQDHFLLAAQYLQNARAIWQHDFATLDSVLLMFFQQRLFSTGNQSKQLSKINICVFNFFKLLCFFF
jgi:hypothetical protein